MEDDAISINSGGEVHYEHYVDGVIPIRHVCYPSNAYFADEMEYHRCRAGYEFRRCSGDYKVGAGGIIEGLPDGGEGVQAQGRL
jgi:hypothetical protein